MAVDVLPSLPAHGALDRPIPSVSGLRRQYSTPQSDGRTKMRRFTYVCASVAAALFLNPSVARRASAGCPGLAAGNRSTAAGLRGATGGPRSAARAMQGGQPAHRSRAAQPGAAPSPPTAPVPPGAEGAGGPTGALPVYGSARRGIEDLQSRHRGDRQFPRRRRTQSPWRRMPALAMPESEASFQAVVDPYARADFFMSFGEERRRARRGLPDVHRRCPAGC